MADAMACVRDELGAEALILATRRVGGGIEVTAALDADPAPSPLALPDAAPALTYHAVPEPLRRRLQTGPLLAALAATFRFAPIALGGAAKPLLLAGPPGAGKTLTAARLATRLVLAGVTPLVITADGQRAGGADQLAAFTNLLGLGLLEAGNPAALRRALAGRSGGGPVLIDLPGGNPFNAEERHELQSFADAASGTIAVVLAAGTDPAEAADLAAAYGEAGAAQLVATRLDVARRIGGVLTAAAAGLALAEAGIGPGAADGLIPLTPDWLAHRLLHPPAGGRKDWRA